MTIVFSLLVALVGLVMYVLSANPKVSEIGRAMMWTGMLAFLLQSAGVFKLVVP